MGGGRGTGYLMTLKDDADCDTMNAKANLEPTRSIYRTKPRNPSKAGSYTNPARTVKQC